MRFITLKTLSLLCAITFLALNLCSCDVDPNVAVEKETTDEYHIIEGDDADRQEVERNGFHAYGSGKTEPVLINDVEVNVCSFALRSYELAYMMAQTAFENPAELPVDIAVQYAFVHIYFPDFHSITNKAMQYKSATPAEICEELQAQFGTDDFPIADSILYNSAKDIFEIWIPEYGVNIYYHIDAVNINGDKAEIITTFYNELKHSTLLGRTHITVKEQDGKPVISSLTAE